MYSAGPRKTQPNGCAIRIAAFCAKGFFWIRGKGFGPGHLIITCDGRLRHEPETEPNLKEMPVPGQDIQNVQVLGNNHRRYVREGNVRFVTKFQAQIVGPLKPRLRDLLNFDKWRRQQAFGKARDLLEWPATIQQGYRLIQNEICRMNAPAHFGSLCVNPGGGVVEWFS
jgi:hypothetical protein